MKKHTCDSHNCTALVLFLAALLIRIIYFYLHKKLTFAYISVGGVPFSDAMAWDKIAMNISQGKGIIGEWSARRPLFPMILSCFYHLFGHSFLIAKIVNIISSALSIPFVYLIGHKISTRGIALVAATAVMISINQLKYSLTIMSEPIGLLFFVLSTYFLIMGLETKRIDLFFISGLFFGLTNLTRTLTLIAFPGLIVCIIYLMKRDRVDLKKAVYSVAAICVGLAIVLTPWIIRQKKVHGIYAISDNSADSFYASTSPTLGIWSSRVEKEAEKRGLRTIKDKHDFYKKEALKNLRNHPDVLMRNFVQNLIRYIGYLNVNKLKFQMVAVIYLILLFLYTYPVLKNKRQLLLSVGTVIVIATVVNNIPINSFCLIIASGIILGIINDKTKYSIILVNELLFISVAILMTGIPILMNRLMILIQWIYYIFYFIAITYAYKIVHEKMISPTSLLNNNSDFRPHVNCRNNIFNRIEKHLAVLTKIIIAFIVLFFISCGIRLLYLNYTYPINKNEIKQVLPSDMVQDVIHQICVHDEKKNIACQYAEKVNTNKYDGPLYEKITQGSIIIFRDRIDSYLYYLKKNESIRHWSRLFYPRRYNRTIIYTENNYYVLFPGTIPQTVIGKDVVIAGMVNIDKKQVYDGKIIIEGIALIPMNPSKNSPDYNQIIIAKNEEHQKIEKKIITNIKGK